MNRIIRAITLTATLAGAAALAACETRGGNVQASTTRPADGQPVTKTVYVAPKTARCVGVAPMECLQVRDHPDGAWSLWYAGIEGFDFKPGFRYELQIDEYKVAQPPADGSSIRWVLKRVVSRVPASE
ncbi:hypothetical protein WT15_08270 [Burkholderia stagnalis]|uniref:DUF4377 domain-containing protein n=1 Tax=Burkholderia stagnalis TaxID=1503054 RepID=UPI0007539738|nr:DUF4377 domain-containing protein [Burkholderia stagnalis]AOK55340.1 hypothetical protein WT74_21135 [Burkholderia stagnalis]KVN82250.1 hypothetical protein WT15_08270 [Burkholderia stagnalis]KWO30400.1 hypothetical protein WT95_18080 [Burkholderia stagnalis]KWO35118.1 hypothetical protein WT96_16925 [Burkholderia stagnalis]